jgi:hypothetical protein
MPWPCHRWRDEFTVTPEAYASSNPRRTSLRFRPSAAARFRTRSRKAAGTRTSTRGEFPSAVASRDGRPGRGRQEDRSNPCSALSASRSRSASDSTRPLFVSTCIASPPCTPRRTSDAAASRGSRRTRRQSVRPRRPQAALRWSRGQGRGPDRRLRNLDRGTNAMHHDVAGSLVRDPVFRGRGPEDDDHLTPSLCRTQPGCQRTRTSVHHPPQGRSAGSPVGYVVRALRTDEPSRFRRPRPRSAHLSRRCRHRRAMGAGRPRSPGESERRPA